MRQIKFRAWDKNNKRYIYIADESNDTAIWFDELGWYIADYFSGEPLELFNYTNGVLEQFTGLYDKNGKEIYVGDIVDSWAGLDTGDMYIRKVVVDDFEPRIRFEPATGFILTKTAEKMFEVIGNVHENPELLEEK